MKSQPSRRFTVSGRPVSAPFHPAARGRRGGAGLRVLVVLACVAVLALFWLLSRLGPRDVDYRELPKAAEVSPELRAVEAESVKFENEFEGAIALREEPLPEDLELLKRALELQRSYVEDLPAFDDGAEERLEGLEKRYQDFAGAALLRESEEHERRAEDLADEGRAEEAIAAYLKAYELQDRINRGFPLSEARNPGRAARLQRNSRYLEADPLFQRSVALAEAARAKGEAEEWEEAEALLRQAIEVQERINREFRGTNQASVGRLKELKLALVTLRSRQDHLAIERLVELADLRRFENRNLEAASLYDEARRMQRKLNEEFPESPYASADRLIEFQRKSQTAQSVDLGRDIEANNDRLDKLLAARRTREAAEIIVRLSRDLGQLRESFPRSSFNDDQLQVKVRYLNLVQSDLGFIQDRIYDSVLPVPGVEGWRLLRTEVPQALFSLIMGTNPSRNLGDVLPVDSVSWIESKRFCERLSWIMGKPVRLPTEYEFRQAVGRLRYVVLEDHAWSVSQTQGETREVGSKEALANGFFDLLGNVSEWLESVDTFENEDALHIGGSAQDSLETIFTVPVRQSSRGERNRNIGFRVAVDLR
jgi:tetratricopeptide (TPR) repeat protein